MQTGVNGYFCKIIFTQVILPCSFFPPLHNVKAFVKKFFFFSLVESSLYHNFKSSTFSSALLSLDGQVNSGGCDCLGQTDKKYIQITAFF